MILLKIAGVAAIALGVLIVFFVLVAVSACCIVSSKCSVNEEAHDEAL